MQVTNGEQKIAKSRERGDRTAVKRHRERRGGRAREWGSRKQEPGKGAEGWRGRREEGSKGGGGRAAPPGLTNRAASSVGILPVSRGSSAIQKRTGSPLAY